MNSTITRCSKCRNFEYTHNVYCRICGFKFSSKSHNLFEKIAPWVLLSVGILGPLIFYFASNNTYFAFLAMLIPFLSVLFSKKLFKVFEHLLWYRKPLLTKYRIMRTKIINTKDGTFDPDLFTSCKSISLICIQDRNIALLIKQIGKNKEFDSMILGQIRKTLNFYRKNENTLSHILPKKEFQSRIILLEHIIHSFINQKNMVNSFNLNYQFKKTLNMMIDEIDNKEAYIEINESLS